MDAVLHPAEPHRDPAAVARLLRSGRAAAVLTGAIGLAALAGWALHVPWLRSAGLPLEMQPNTGLGLVLSAAAVLLSGAPGPRPRAAGFALAAAVFLLGAVTTAEHLLGVDLWIDHLLYKSPVGTLGTTSPGRMGPPVAASFLASGIAMMALQARATGGRMFAQAVALGVAPLPLLAVVGYAYDVSVLNSLSALSGVALPTALALLLLQGGILLARPDRGFVSNLASAGSGGAIARRMLVYALALPMLLGRIALAVSGRAGTHGALAVSILVVAVTLVLVLLVLRDAVALDRMEVAKERAQAEREASRDELSRALTREQEARAHAEASNRAKDEFLNALSHELRTPLNAILGWSRLLRDAGADRAKLERGLAVVERNGRSLAQVVSDLLDMSRIVRGAIQLERMEVDLVSALEGAVEAVRPAADAKGVKIGRSVADGVPRVIGDPVRLQQIAWNLLSNAVKFTPQGGRVDVAISTEGGRAIFTVEDTGVGIAPEFLPNVFDRFRQADGSATRRHGGLGLGLALTRELVVLHGGTIEVASAGVDRGASFRAAFPPAEPSPEAVPPPHPERAQLGGARILVVDDEADSRELLLQLLASWGARPAGAASARDALASAARERPDLLVSDIAMPGEDGYALLHELRRVERALGQLPVPAVALTAFARPEDRRKVLAAGFDAHVAKPVEPDELRATLSALLRREPQPAAPPVGVLAGARAGVAASGTRVLS